MEDLIIRLQLRSTVQDYVTQLMVQNNITASQMEDALNHVMLIVREAALSEYAAYAEQFYNKDKMEALQNLVQSYAEEGKEPQIIDDNMSTPIEAEALKEE